MMTVLDKIKSFFKRGKPPKVAEEKPPESIVEMLLCYLDRAVASMAYWREAYHPGTKEDSTSNLGY
jgi:hypothetical protein